MLHFPKWIMILFSIIQISLFSLEAKEKRTKQTIPSRYVTKTAWNNVGPHLIPNDHPAKPKLDEIFNRSRALYDQGSMTAAGFDALPPQHHTEIIVAKHHELKGYVIKAYLDVQEYYQNKPEEYFWLKRVRGAKLIRKCLKENHYEHLIKVPRKWLYLLPDRPSPPKKCLRKRFILIAEDMELHNQEENEKAWGSEIVTKEFLAAFYQITTELKLLDSSKPDNCWFSLDGRAAFVDTELYLKGEVKYYRLLPFLSAPMQEYWKELSKDQKRSLE